MRLFLAALFSIPITFLAVLAFVACRAAVRDAIEEFGRRTVLSVILIYLLVVSSMFHVLGKPHSKKILSSRCEAVTNLQEPVGADSQ